MKKDLTELVFILDKSGSMSGLEKDTIGGFNSMLTKQKSEAGDAIVTTVLFDNRYELLHDRIGIKGIKPMTEKEYFVEGSTALLDAMGRTINKIVNVHKHIAEDEKPEKVVFVITTDGMENSSTEFNSKKIKSMVETQRKKYGWEFIFLGANIDAIETAKSYGIDEDMAVEYMCDEAGTALNYQTVSSAISKMRCGEAVNKSWKQNIEKDLANRGKKNKR